MTRPWRFKLTTVTRAVNAARKAGLVVARVELDEATGKIIIISKDGKPTSGGDDVAQDASKVAQERIEQMRAKPQ
jgi:hypothetical protein